jgi:hypothetical protein
LAVGASGVAATRDAAATTPAHPSLKQKRISLF